jgi:uncharacterized protein (DUF924 family)
MTLSQLAHEIVDFWKSAGPKRWYAKDFDFDNEFRHRFESAHFAAARREYEEWTKSATGSLALLLLLDQFPRNCFRGSGHAFATDSLARSIAYQAIAKGHHLEFAPDLRQFLLLPLMHSEALEDQDRLLELCRDMPETLRYAEIHRDIIVKFGRFPHRNFALGRATTTEEEAFLAAGGFSG